MKSDTISIGKGICILLMVMAHAGSPIWMTRFIYMFHMPFFFIISGFCLKNIYFNQTRNFLRKRVKGLYLPYVKWSFIFLLLHNLFFYINFYDNQYGYVILSDYTQVPQKPYELKDFVSHGINILTKMEGHEQLLGGYWFMKELFLGSIIGFIICKYIPPIMSTLKFPIYSIVSILLLLLTKGLYVQLFSLNWITFFSAFYYCVGYDIKRLKFSIKNSYIILLFLIIGIVSFILPEFEMGKQSLKYIFMYIIVSILGFFFVMNIATFINNFSSKIKLFFIYCGNNTLFILTWHFLCFKLISILIVLVNKEPINRIAEFPQIRAYSQEGWWIAYTVIGVILPLLILQCKNYTSLLKKASIKNEQY